MTSFQTNQPGPAWSSFLAPGAATAGPRHARLSMALREAIRIGGLPPGAVLPPSRELAAELGCSRWVVTEAYEQLVAEGYLEARVGSGTRVRGAGGALGAGPAALTPPAPFAADAAIDLAPGLPDLRHFPLAAWLAALRSVAASLPFAELAYPEPFGHATLRELLAAYLGRVRGAATEASQVTITTGATDGLTRICRALRAAGAEAVAVEDPGWGRLRSAAEVAGLEVVPIPVDGEGLRVDVLARLERAQMSADAPGLHAEPPRVRAAIVSPAHQFPSGSVLSPVRRAALLEWARRAGGLIVEDDYDAEFRYDRRPVGALQGTDPGRVALLGSLSKTLSPALGIGWMVTPRAWTDAVRAVEVRPAAPPLLDQLAFAEMLSSGAYDRQLRAARKRYRVRRDRLVRALAERLPSAAISGAAAGLHLVVRFDRGYGRLEAERRARPADHGAPPGPAIVAAAARQGVRIASVEQYRSLRESAPGGLVLGYGNLGDGEVDRAVAGLAQAVAEWSATG